MDTVSWSFTLSDIGPFSCLIYVVPTVGLRTSNSTTAAPARYRPQCRRLIDFPDAIDRRAPFEPPCADRDDPVQPVILLRGGIEAHRNAPVNVSAGTRLGNRM